MRQLNFPGFFARILASCKFSHQSLHSSRLWNPDDRLTYHRLALTSSYYGDLIRKRCIDVFHSHIYAHGFYVPLSLYYDK